MLVNRFNILLFVIIIFLGCNNNSEDHNNVEKEIIMHNEHQHVHDENCSDENIILTEKQEKLVGLKTEKVEKKGFINSLEYPAEILYNPSGVTSEVIPISGRVLRLNFEYGSKVQKGNLLAIIENPQNMGQKFEVRASSSGIVIKKNINSGQWVEPGTQICEIANNNIDGVIKVFPDEIEKIKIGQLVEFSKNNTSIRSKINYISPVLDPITKTIEVRAKIYNNNSIPVNSLVSAKIVIGTKKCIVISRSAILNEDDHYIVYVKKDNSYEKRIVQIGSKDKEQVEIVNGLAEGELIVIEGAYNLKNINYGSSEGGRCEH